MSRIPEPRRYGSFAADDALGVLVRRNADGDQQTRRTLSAWVSDRLDTQGDEEIHHALRQAPSQIAYSKLWDLVCHAIEAAGVKAGDATLIARIFAIPIVLVTAAREDSLVSGTLPDIDEIHALLERHGAIGATRNFGLSNALCSIEALERLKPSLVYQWTRQWAGTPRELAPEALHVERGRERVQLRFLVGAGIAPADAPSFSETMSGIGAWGLPLTKALVRQLAQPAAELLAIPRAPVGLLRAPHAGRWAGLETALHLFTSNTLRHMRAVVGDPTVMVSAHRAEDASAEVRTSMSSPLDDTLLEGFRWPLHPIDDLDRIEQVVTELMRDCQVPDVRFIEHVLPERLASGRLFLREDDRIASAVPH